MIRGSGCLVLAPPSMAMPKIDLVFFTVMRRFPWWSGTTRAPSSSRRSDISPRVSRCTLWCRRGGPPAVPLPAGPPPEPPSSSSCASCMSKLRESLCASSWNGYNLYSNDSQTPQTPLPLRRIRVSNRKLIDYALVFGHIYQNTNDLSICKFSSFVIFCKYNK